MEKNGRNTGKDKSKLNDKEISWNEYGERVYPDFIKESQAAYQAAGNPALKRLLAKRQGEYTVEDYYALPEDCRVELIDGTFYNMAAPSGQHQDIGGEIFYQLKSYTKRKKGKCIVRIAPSDVQLDCDNKTMVQPDIYVGCDREKFLNQVYYGAPDLVIEILSPSSGKRDREIKYRKYKKAGVREYWLVDPKAKRVTVYDFEHEERAAVYTFNDKIPVGIWSEKCSNKYLNDGGEWFDVDLRELLE